jgi:formylglycine-generating enzyme required for sulfatase activity
VPTPDYYIDQHEVTNAEFKAFVDAGGCVKQEYWTQPFVRDGQTLDWTTAMTLFRDGAGRPGPATWQGGTYPVASSGELLLALILRRVYPRRWCGLTSTECFCARGC